MLILRSILIIMIEAVRSHSTCFEKTDILEEMFVALNTVVFVISA